MSDGEQTYEQEVQLGALFQSIGSAFKRMEKAAGNDSVVQDELKGISASLQEGRACVASPSSLAGCTDCPLTLSI